MKRIMQTFLLIMLSFTMVACNSSGVMPDPNIVNGSIQIVNNTEQPNEQIVTETSQDSPKVNSDTNQKQSEAITKTEIKSDDKQDQSTRDEQLTQTPQTVSSIPRDEYRAIWISYLEIGKILTAKSESQFRSSIGTMFDNIVNLGLNTVICHVRPFGDALYDSSIFPTSYLITGKEGDPLSFDPLSIMVSEAHARGLDIEAWVNPYRVRTSSSKALCESNPAKAWLQNGSDTVYTKGDGIYYNPGSEEAISLIVNGCKEIAKNYDVDGIHFDDYFYASTDSTIDSELYSSYLSEGGTMSLINWRLNNVNQLVKRVYSAIKSVNSDCRFGISPQGNMKNNLNSQYADVETWLSTSGYVDYICPQIYYGFSHSTCAFDKVAAQFNSMIKVSDIDLYMGLAAYKIGTIDNYAGDKGKYEWQNSSDLLSRMVLFGREQSHYEGFCLYSYSSVFSPSSDVKSQVTAEISNLKSVL